jgi:glycosyltransferase involved in cell wall biosynthesis
MEAKSLKILHVTEYYPPSVGGVPETVRQISERLVKVGHSVTVATSWIPSRPHVQRGVEIKSFHISGNLVEGFRGRVEDYRDFLLYSDYDVVCFFAAQQWGTDLALPVLDRIRAKKIFASAGFSRKDDPRYRKYYEKLALLLGRFDALVFLSEDLPDFKFAQDYGCKSLFVIPNGASEEEFTERKGAEIRNSLGISTEDLLILSVGSHTSLKGHRECFEIFSRAKIAKSTLLIIGNHTRSNRVFWIAKTLKLLWERGRVDCPGLCCLAESIYNHRTSFRKMGKKVLVRDLDRQSTVSAFMEADVFLFPSNVECSPLTLFECLASGTPFLSTDVGNAAEIARTTGGGRIIPSRQLLDGRVVPDMEVAVSMLETLARDPAGREKMAMKGHSAWAEKFTWAKVASRYNALYESLVGGNGSK